MSPTLWLAIRIRGRRIPLPLLLILPLALVAEILALLPVAIYAIRKKEALPLKLVSRFYLSRLMLVFILHGGKFNVSVCEGTDRVQISGRIRC